MSHVEVVSRTPLLATFRLARNDGFRSWRTERFDGIDALVTALRPWASDEPVSADTLASVERSVKEVCTSVVAVNPRGQACDDGMEIEEDDMPSMDRFEVCFDDAWASEMSARHPDFGEISRAMTETATALASHDDGVLKAYWRINVVFAGARAQEWHADDVDGHDILIAEVELTRSVGGATVFPFDDDGTANFDALSSSELRPHDGVVYSGATIRFGDCHDAAADPRVTLQLILSARGDPNDALASSDDDSEDDGEDGDDGEILDGSEFD